MNADDRDFENWRLDEERWQTKARKHKRRHISLIKSRQARLQHEGRYSQEPSIEERND